ncbi:MAG: hypothetical protein EGR90_09155 [Lachnospiraceae bacterium]|nr:hypothetical protein [Lachnospiraceae bacterium]
MEKEVIHRRKLNPLLLQRQSHFAAQNKEAKSSAPAEAVAFCCAKQGGLIWRKRKKTNPLWLSLPH